MTLRDKVNTIFHLPLFRNMGIYAFSSYLNKAIPFMLLPILTKRLSAVEYGEVSMFITFVSILVAIVSWNIDGAVIRKYYDVGKNGMAEVISSYFTILGLSLFVSLIIIYVFRIPICNAVGIRPVYIWPAVTCSVFNVISSCVNNLYQVEEKAVAYTVYTNLSSLTNLALSMIFVVYLGLGADGWVAGISISTVIFGCIGIVLIIKETGGISLHININTIKEELFVFGIPALPMNLRGLILSVTDRIFIVSMISVSEAGVYTVGNQLATVIEVFVRSIALAFTPWVYQRLSQKNRKMQRKVVKYSLLLAALIFLTSAAWYFLSRIGIHIFLGSMFWNAAVYSSWLIFGKMLMGFQLLLVNFIYYYKWTRSYAYISILSIILNVIFNYQLVSRFGSVGAAIATFMVYFITFVLSLILVFFVLKKEWTDEFSDRR